MPEFQIIHDEEREEQSRGRKAFTFTVDGVPSLLWFPNALDEEGHPGRPADYFVQRTIRRLQEGRSAEAFGDAGPAIAVVGAVQVAQSVSRSPRKARGKVVTKEVPERAEAVTDMRGKPREPRPTYTYELDGKPSDRTYATEKEAAAACAIAAFMTRGKLGRIPDAQAALEEQFPDCVCEVYACPTQHKVCARVDDEDYAVGFEADGTFRFKKVAGEGTESE